MRPGGEIGIAATSHGFPMQGQCGPSEMGLRGLIYNLVWPFGAEYVSLRYDPCGRPEASERPTPLPWSHPLGMTQQTASACDLEERGALRI